MKTTEEAMRQALKEKGHRMTVARGAIIETLVNSQGHVSADELAALVRQTWPGIGRMTIYRTLDLLVESGLIRPVYQRSGAARYVILESGRHHHLICSRCDQVQEIDACLLNDLEGALTGQRDFKPSGHLLEIYGLCADCDQTKSS